MHQQLTSLSDKELISRTRKQKDRESEGVLMDRYSHLLVAITLPQLQKNPSLDPNIVFPTLLQRLSASLRTQSIYKANEWIMHTQRAYLNNQEKATPFYPSREARDLLHIENKVDKASTNTIDRQEIILRLEQALQRLAPEEKELLDEFYVEQKSFSDLAAAKGWNRDKVRNQLKAAKAKLAKLFINQAYVK
ncbi:sigma factor-like helix-turn-helix DNA-binding protein [Chitinophaga sp. CB10]|uniref:sigma factor-like helix-turn-helix DNA-binding protein n=1 Tax=Chitinophaga sp. CB10 TaxID=1891659 RepID=UPI0025BA9C32|nr:sigma factor-like helix-turn-helix DNA-binding protein [Chitinophaga sp. CB10]